MNRYSVKAAACALVGTLSLSGYQMTLEAKINNSSDVPAAGVAVVLDEGSTIQELQVEVVLLSWNAGHWLDSESGVYEILSFDKGEDGGDSGRDRED